MPYKCSRCGASAPSWSVFCSYCSTPDSLILLERASAHPVKRTVARLSDIHAARESRLATGVPELDECLGDGIVIGASTLLAGSPGAGKSTLALQSACHVAVTENVIYFSGEEDLTRLRLRADRLRLPITQLRVSRFTTTDRIQALTHQERARLIVIDSLQTITCPDLRNRAGSPTQLITCANLLTKLAQRLRAAVLIIGHVTKEDDLSGPRTLEHVVDVMAFFSAEPESAKRILYCSKNRFGPSYIKYRMELHSNGRF